MRRLQLLVIALCLAAPTAASAQIVNAFSRLPGRPPKGVDGDLQLSVDWRSGNVDYLQVGGMLGGSWHQKRHTVFVLAEGDHQFAAGRLILEHSLEQVRYRYQVNDFLAPELFVQHEYAPFRRLALRVLYGGDLRFAMRVGDYVEVSFGFGLMGEHAGLLHDGLPSAGLVRDDLRYSTYLGLRIHAAHHLELGEVTFLQDRQDDPGDARLVSYTSLFGKVNDWLDLGVIFTVDVDGQPPPQVKPVDTSLRSFLSVSL